MSESLSDTIRKTLEVLHQERHEYAITTLDAYPDLDRAFYEESTQALLNSGFTMLGDVENVTVTRQNPSFRTCLRSFSGDGDCVSAAVYHVRPKGLLRVLQWIGLLPRSMRVIDLETEFSNGTFVCTTNVPAGQQILTGPRVQMTYRKGWSVGPLLQLHRQAIAAHGAASATQPVRVGSMEATLEMQQRLQTAKAIHRKASITRESIRAMVGPAVADSVIDDVYRQLKGSPGGAGDTAAGPPKAGVRGKVILWVASFLVTLVVCRVFDDDDGRDRPPPPMPAPPVARVEGPKASDAQVEAMLAPYKARLDASRREVARITLTPMTKDDLRVSKVGGTPYPSRGELTPRTADGKRMVLLAQINFAEVPPMQGYPTGGILQFFIVAESDDYPYGMNLRGREPDALQSQHSFRVRYIEQVDAFDSWWTPLPPPAGSGTPHDARKPRRMTFRPASEPISATDVDFESVAGFDPDDLIEAQAEAAKVDLYDLAERALPTASGHKLGGYPFFTQSDPRPEGSPLRLLLQLDTDDEMMWGDSGVGGFFIDPADLARRDFTRVLYSWDCY